MLQAEAARALQEAEATASTGEVSDEG
jgi:hypothetical protein